jgi:hypothetical protein
MQHNVQSDCWTSYNGKVYNITQYLDYHPGGIPILMEAAGKDCTNLFNKYHRWINIENMLDTCLIGDIIEEMNEANESKENNINCNNETMEKAIFDIPLSSETSRSHSPENIDYEQIDNIPTSNSILDKAIKLLNLDSDED